MTTLDLAQRLAPQDADGPEFFATVTQIYANGLVDVDFGGGRKATSCLVRDTYIPATGQQVTVRRFNAALWIVEGGVRTSNPTTVTVGRQWTFPFNITQGAPGVSNPYVVNAAATHSWRNTEGWGVTIGDTVGQGAFTAQYGYYQGCYFYGGSAFSALAGRRCTGITIKLVRTGSGGASGATPQYIGPHPHGSQPADQPLFAWGSRNVGSLSWSSSGTFTLPTEWGQALIDGTVKGFGHLLLASGNGNYSLNAGQSADSTTGQVSLSWA